MPDSAVSGQCEKRKCHKCYNFITHKLPTIPRMEVALCKFRLLKSPCYCYQGKTKAIYKIKKENCGRFSG